MAAEVRTILLVIPDTNVLFSDPFLERPSIKTILAAENQTGIRLVIPEVVIDELRNHVEEQLEETVKAADKVRRQYSRLSGLEPYAVDLRIGKDQRRAVLDRFERRIQQLDKEGRILKYPSMSPKELARRSIKNRLPFRDKDRGMRDTLIWLTAKECAIKGASSGMKITLVSEDGAFWDKDNSTMREGLTAELKDAGIPLDSISVGPTLQNVIDTLVSRKLPPVKWVEVAIQGGQIDDFTVSSDKVLLEATDWILHNPEILEVGDYSSVEFDMVEEAAFHGIERTLDLGGGEALVESKWTCNVSAEGYDNPYFHYGLRVELEFKLSSIVKVDNSCPSVKSHEITDMEVIEVSETEPDILMK